MFNRLPPHPRSPQQYHYCRSLLSHAVTPRDNILLNFSLVPWPFQEGGHQEKRTKALWALRGISRPRLTRGSPHPMLSFLHPYSRVGGPAGTSNLCPQASSLSGHPYVLQDSEQSGIVMRCPRAPHSSSPGCLQCNHPCHRDYKAGACRSAPESPPAGTTATPFPLSSKFHWPGSFPIRFPRALPTPGHITCTLSSPLSPALP